MDLAIFHTKQYDAETQWVAQVAHSIKQAQPDIDWSECIRIAEKALKESK
jgi:hypothetical protein